MVTGLESPTETNDRTAPLILAGGPVAKEIRTKCAEEVRALRSRHPILPGLSIVRLGDDPASLNYAKRITQAFEGTGLRADILALPHNASRHELQAELGRLSVLPQYAGVLVQMPLPPHIGLDAVIDVLDPDKDVDGIHPLNAGRLSLGLECYVPATPAGGLALLDHYGIGVEGKRALVIGRSDIVGKPLAQLLLARNATVTVAHSRSKDLGALIAEADIVAAAIGKPGLVQGSMIKPGAVVLDFGAAMVEGHMKGDVDYEGALERAGAITPVPGGTGPMTNAMLLRNTIQAIKKYFG